MVVNFGLRAPPALDKAHGGHFVCGMAFNQYEPVEHELQKMKRKLAAGARFIITQPVIGRDERVLHLAELGAPVHTGAWMSKRIDLLKQCLGVEGENIPVDYDPLKKLQILREIYRDYGIYCSLPGFKRDWKGVVIRRFK